MRSWTKFFSIAICMAFIFSLVAEDADARRKRRRAKKKKTQMVQPVEPPPEPFESQHRSAGCGLGAMVFKEPDKVSQVGASILNGTGLQSVWITFGLSNCTEDGVVEASRQKEAFIETNYADLNRDIAVGEGEFVTALGDLYGCSPAANQQFVHILHSNYASIQQLGPNARKVLLRIDALYREDPLLRKACQI